VKPEATPAPPVIPDYELLRLVGRGSYGDVWLARGITGLYRAVKIVWRDRFDDLLPYEREFKGLREFAAISFTEARQLALLHVGRNDTAGFFYYVMELADDAATGSAIDPAGYVPHTLKAVRARRGRVPAPQVIALGADLARALAGLHAHGLVHRDIKPSNVIFVGGAPKLADIGLVTATISAQTFVGTEGFVPPEGPGTPAADVFSLGKLLYEISTGLDRHDYPRLPADLDRLPDSKPMLELNEILIRACDPAPGKRYPDAAALLDDLLLLQAGHSIRRVRATERTLMRAGRIGALLGMIATIAGTSVYVERQRAAQENVLRRKSEHEDRTKKAAYSAGLARAQREIELGSLGQARKELGELLPENGSPDLRGFEWHMLWNEAQGDRAELLQRSGPAVEQVRFSPDGRHLAWQGADARAVLWDVSTHQPVQNMEGISHLAGFSADGQWLIGADRQAAFQRWSVETALPDRDPAIPFNHPLATLAQGDQGICFTESDAGTTHSLRVWDFARHVEIMRVPITSDADGRHWDFYRSTVSENSRVCTIALTTGRGPGTSWQLQSFDLAARKQLRADPLPQAPAALALSPDGTRLAVVLADSSQVQVWDLANGARFWQQSFGSGQPETAAFSPDGTRLAIAGRDSVIHVIDAATGSLLNSLRGHEGGVTALAWSPTGHVLVSGGTPGDLRLWTEPAQPRLRLAGHEPGNPPLHHPGGGVCLSRDGRRLAVSREETGVNILATETLELLTTFPGPARPICFAEDDRVLLALTPQGQLKRWQLDAPASMADEFIPFKDGSTTHVALATNGRWLAATNGTGKIQVWDWPAKQRLFEQQAHSSAARGLAFSPDGETLVSVGDDRKTKSWVTRTGQLRAAWTTGSNPLNLCFSARDGSLAVGHGRGTVQLCSLDSTEAPRILHTRNARSTALVFSPDGSRLLCGGPNGVLQVYATDDWREVTTLAAGSARDPVNDVVTALEFSPDSRVLAAYLADGCLRVWRH
jgi:WD40 repeat protein